MNEFEQDILKMLQHTAKKDGFSDDFIDNVLLLRKTNPVPHAELKAQYARDVETCKTIDGLDAWQLWQYFDDGEWNVVPMAAPSWTYKTRRHPHADSIIAYQKCSERDKNRWQYSYRDAWIDCDGEPDWYEHTPAFRLKPETITISGKEYAAPLRVAPAIDAKYWVCNFNFTTGFESWSVSWEGDSDDNCLLEKRHVFATKQDCQAVADAFNAVLLGDDNDN